MSARRWYYQRRCLAVLSAPPSGTASPNGPRNAVPQRADFQGIILGPISVWLAASVTVAEDAAHADTYRVRITFELFTSALGTFYLHDAIRIYPLRHAS